MPFFRTGVFYWLAGCLLTIAPGCDFSGFKKEELVEVKVSEEFRDFVDFNPGSYWIFADSLTGVTDTLSLTSILWRMHNQPGNPELQEGVVGYFRSSFHGFNIFFNGGVISGNPYFAYLGWGKEGIAPSLEDIFFDPSEPGNSASSLCLASFDTFSLNGQDYPNVKLYLAGGAVPPLHTERIYWSRGVGIIKHTSRSGKVWELLEYKHM